MTILDVIKKARADADAYYKMTEFGPLEAVLTGADEASGKAFGDLGLHTILHQTVFEYAFGSRLLMHLELRTPVVDARPETLEDLVSHQQLWLIWSIARERGLNAEKECEALYNYHLEEISKRAASALIDHLKRKAPAIAAPVERPEEIQERPDQEEEVQV
jgi:hypothetical protein